ncbi:MAG: ThuA domain-containing protein [Bryobacteraceae bacterium]
MKAIRIVTALILSAAFSSVLPAQVKRKKILAIGRSQGYQHDSASHGLATIWRLGQETGLWDTFIKTDTELITKKKHKGNRKNLDDFDAVFFFTSGELELDDEQKASLLSFVRDDGKGFLGAHSATDTLYNWPEYGEMIGGYFDLHPWHQPVRIKIEDPAFPATKHFPPSFEIADEIYQFRNFARDRVRVLMSVDTSTVDLTKPEVHRADKDFAVTWVRPYGKGRVFYSALGHREEVWNRADIRKMWVEGVQWALGITPGEAAPRPKPIE